MSFKKQNLGNIATVDVETGGLNPEKNGVCSVTIKKYDSSEVLNLFIKPNQGLRYDEKALEVNGLTMQYLEEHGIPEETAVKTITFFIKANFTTKPLILGHNTNFDLRFIERLFERNNLKLYDYIDYHYLDSMILAGSLMVAGVIDRDSVSLGSIHWSLFGEPIANQHSSLADVMATERVFKKLIGKISQ